MEGQTDKETTTPPEELEQSVTSERSDLAADEVRRGQRTRKMTEKVRENKITALTNSFWKLHGKFAREIIQTETTMGKFCTKDTLGFRIYITVNSKTGWIYAGVYHTCRSLYDCISV